MRFRHVVESRELGVGNPDVRRPLIDGADDWHKLDLLDRQPESRIPGATAMVT